MRQISNYLFCASFLSGILVLQALAAFIFFWWHQTDFFFKISFSNCSHWKDWSDRSKYVRVSDRRCISFFQQFAHIFLNSVYTVFLFLYRTLLCIGNLFWCILPGRDLASFVKSSMLLIIYFYSYVFIMYY